MKNLLIGALSRGRRLFLLIAEPRFIRIILFWIYLGLVYMGHTVLSAPSDMFRDALGVLLTPVFGWLMLAGGVFGSIGVLPGIWWLERAGVLLAMSALSIYVIVITAVGRGTGLGSVVGLMLISFLLIRWILIRPRLVAPRRVPRR